MNESPPTIKNRDMYPTNPAGNRCDTSAPRIDHQYAALPRPHAKSDCAAKTGAKVYTKDTIPKKITEDPQLPSASPAQLLLSPPTS